jgi:FtsZ-binding cell division protein ZapB
LVDPSTGEVADLPTIHALQAEVAQLKEDCALLEVELRAKRSQNTKLKNENARLMGLEPEHGEILDVLEFACQRLMPGASIVAGSKRWMAVRARLRDVDPRTRARKFTPLKLKGAAIGALLDPWTMDRRQRHRRDPEFVFADAGKVDRYLMGAIAFKRTYGESGLAIVDELAGEGVRWLAEQCSCGGLWIEHLRGGPGPDGLQPCARTGCANFDTFHAKVERFMAEHGTAA